MRNIGLVAFTVTTCVLVPAVVNLLDAGHEQLAKLGAPDDGTIELDGVKVTASLDRWMVDPGGGLTVKLVASDPKKRELRVGVLVLGSSGNEGDRVPSPPNGVAHQTVTLDFKHGVASKTITIPLKGAVTREWDPFGHYTVLVGAPKTIAKLERLRGRSGYEGDVDEGIPDLNKAGEEFMSAYWQIGRGEPGVDDEPDSPYALNKIARLEAHTRPKSGAVALAMPDTARVGEEFSVTLTVKNPGRKKLTGLEISLVEHRGVGAGVEDDQAHLLSINPATVKIDLAGKATEQVSFRVKANAAGVIGLYGNAHCQENPDEEEQCQDVQAIMLGTFDAIEISPVETGTPTVAAR